MRSYEYFEEKKTALKKQVEAAAVSGEVLGLAKKTSNLFRYRSEENKKKLSVDEFSGVLAIDADAGVADVLGMTTYEDFVEETVKAGFMPAVVPELKTITVGGAITGVGIEASSFKFGLVHESMRELEVILPDGRIVIATADNEFRDLFFGFPNSYGTLGYILRVKVDVIKIKPFVRVEHTPFSTPEEFFSVLNNTCLEARLSSSYDFIEGVMFSESEFVLSKAVFTENAPYTSNYKFMKKYFESLKKEQVDFLSVKDFIWRWDTDWFWCSKHFGMYNKVLRFLFGKFMLRSSVYWKLRNFSHKSKVFRYVSSLSKKKTESVVQDVEIPVQNATQFVKFFNKEIGILPVWICPTMARSTHTKFDLYMMDPLTLYINFGFWDVVPTKEADGFFNRKIEKKVRELNGKKSLYSTSFYEEDEFWQLYNKEKYDVLKFLYDPEGRTKNLYEKCVLRR